MSKQLSILIIDDDRMIRQVLKSALSRINIVVHTAEDGPSGLLLAQEEDIDVILLDWMMPEMDGMEVLKRLRQNVDTQCIPIFMLTSKDSESDIGQAVLAGVNDYIAKPFSAVEVGEIIMEKLGNMQDAYAGKSKFHFTNIFPKKS
jgi:DNA-binding response OmpR family regulator